MRFYCSIFLIIISLTAFSQEETFQEELVKLEEALNNSDKLGLRISACREIIEISFPNHLKYVKKYSDELLKLSESANDNNTKAYAYFYLGEYFYKNDDFENAEKNYEESLAIYKNLENLSQTAQIYHNLGLTNHYLNHYDKALSYYQKSVELVESLGNKERAAISYQDIGTLYFDIQKYSLAQHYYEKAIEIYRETNNEEKIAAIYQNIGVLHFSWGNFEKSLEFYKKSLAIYYSQNDKQNIGISLSNIGLVYEENKKYNEALEYYLKALLVFEEIGYKPTLVYIFYNLGSLYRNIEDYSKSYEYFEKGLELSVEISMRDYISYNYEALSALYEETGNFKKALYYFKEYVEVKDSLLNEEKFRQIEEIEAQFQNAHHQKEIEFLKIDQDLKELQLKKKEIQILVLVFSSILAFAIVLILWAFNRTQKKSANKLENEIIERVKSENKLIEIKEDLEQRVQSRTADLEQSNRKLILEVKEHEKTAERLIIAKDKAEDADRLKSNFLANMSHEVRTPMNAIGGFSQLLISEDISTEKRTIYAEKITNGCKCLTNLIDEIMDFAEIDSGSITINKVEFNPHPILEYLSDKFTGEILNKGKENLKLIYHNENIENDIVIKTDNSRLKQIISILLDNAIKFTKKGVIEFGFTHPNDKELHFFVKDTGIGIDNKYEEAIFERFRQIDDRISKTYGGAGIGLSVAKKLVELLGGRIWFDSSLNRGTTFYFSLPFNEDIESFTKYEPDELDWSDKVILVAEDKEINFEIIKETLSPTNVNLIWTKNGEETFKRVENGEKIDLILMDIQMPIMDGYECTKRIKEITNEIPVIAQTAYALPQDSYKCFEAGCDDYIAKPISLHQLTEKINKHLLKVKS